MNEIHERASKLSIAAQKLCFERGCHKSTPSDWWMSLTSQHLQTGVHCCLALRGLTMEMPQQDVGRVIDIEHDTLRTVTADLNNDWPFKSARAGHHPPLHPAATASLAFISLPKYSAAPSQLNLVAGVQEIVMSAVWFMSGWRGLASSISTMSPCASVAQLVQAYACTFPLPALHAAIHCMAEVGSSDIATRFAKPTKALLAASTGMCPAYASQHALRAVS